VASLNKIEIFDKNFVLFKTIAVQGRVNAMVFLPLGDFLWVGMANGKLLNFTIQGKTRNSVLEFQTLNSLAYDPHSNLLIAAGIDSKIALWEKGSVGVRKLQGHNGAINKLKFSADGSFFVSVSDDSTAVIWNKDGDRQAVLRGHSAEVASVAISPDGETIYTVGADSCLIKWDTSGNELARIHAHNAPIADIAVSPDGKYIASSSLGDGCKIWNASLGLLFEYPRESKDIYNSLVSFSPDGRYLLLSRENTVTQLGEVVILPIDMNFILQIIRDEVLDGQTFTEAVF
jgi:WD40 repeat protein